MAADIITKMDDYAGNDQYQAFYTQKIDWSTEACEGTQIHLRPGRTYQCAPSKHPKTGTTHQWAPSTFASSSNTATETQYPTTRRLLLSSPGGLSGQGINFGAVINQYICASESHNGIDPSGVRLSTNLQRQQPKPDVNGSVCFAGDITIFSYDRPGDDERGRFSGDL